MKNRVAFLVFIAFLTLAPLFFNSIVFAENEAGYWKLTGSEGSTGFSVPGPEWTSKEAFSASGGATWSNYLNGKLIHQSNFTWTQLPEKVFPGEIFPFTATGKVIFHQDPWNVSGGLTIQFYGALYPLHWLVGDTDRPSVEVFKEVTIDAKVPIGNPDRSKDDHFLLLRLSCANMNNPNPFRYVYEWIPANTEVPDVSVSGSMSISLGEIMGKTWRFGRSDKTVLAGSMRFGPNGKIINGTGHPNESSWKFENGVLAIYGSDGRITTKFNKFQKDNGTCYISGPYSYDSAFLHVLEEVK